MTGLSCVPVAGKDTNLFSLHRRPINRRSHGRSTCCGSEKKFRNVQIRYARCTRFGCKYRGPIGVSSSRTPSLSFSIHIDLAHLEKTANSAFAFEAGHYCTRDGAMGTKLSWGASFLFLDQIEKRARRRPQRERDHRLSADLWQQLDAVEGCGNPHALALRFLHPHDRGLAERPSSRP